MNAEPADAAGVPLSQSLLVSGGDVGDRAIAGAVRSQIVWAAVSIAAAWLLLRLAYCVWFSPWDLVGDEAYYWVQSQHPALSYAEKGPLLAWAIAASGALFGHHPWAVRLPVVIASAAALAGVFAWTWLLVPRDASGRRAAWFAAAMFVLTPALVANGQICTQDGLLIPWLLALAMIGWRVVLDWEHRRSAWANTIAFYLVLGAGVLLKQSVLLALSGFAAYALVRRKHIAWRWSHVWQQMVGMAVVALACAPMLAWDAVHGWPMLRHTLEHLGAAEGEFASRAKGNPLTWFGNTIGGLVGAAGPSFAVMIWASLAAVRRHRCEPEDQRNGRGGTELRWRTDLWVMCTAWPTILFFVLLSFTKPVVPSWPLPSLITLVPLAAMFLSERLPAQRENWLTRTWRGTVAYGVGGLVLLSFPTLLVHFPVLGATFRDKVVDRLTGQQAKADAVARVAAAHPEVRTIVAGHYQKASLLAFYLPQGRWTVTCSGSAAGKRLSNFDEWPDTSLFGEQFRGQTLLLIGGAQWHWQDALAFDGVDPAGDGYWLGKGYQGVRIDHATARETADATARPKHHPSRSR